MIRVKDAEVHMSGDFPKLFIDLVLILHSFLGMAEEEIGRKQAEKVLTLAGKFAVLAPEELEKRFEDIVEEFKGDSRL